MKDMEDFIIRTPWLEYLPVAIFVLAVILAILLVIIGFQIHSRIKNKSLRSRKRRSAFAAEYEEFFAVNAASSVPLKRNNEPVPDDRSFPRIIPPPSDVPGRPVPEPRAGVLEIYFEYEDDYRI